MSNRQSCICSFTNLLSIHFDGYNYMKGIKP